MYTIDGERIKERARELGFNRVGLTRAAPSPQLNAYFHWLEAGHHGTMDYLSRPDRIARRRDADRRKRREHALRGIARHASLLHGGDVRRQPMPGQRRDRQRLQLADAECALVHGGDEFGAHGAGHAGDGEHLLASDFFLSGERDRGDAEAAARVPALSLTEALRNKRVLGFLAVWFGVNIIFGVGSIAIGAEGASVAWQAHIGGFLAGLMLFSLFDPVPRAVGDAASASSPDASTRG